MPSMKSSPKKVTLFYLYGQHNAGDAAIGLGALAFLRNQGFDITAFSRWPDAFPEFQKDRDYYTQHFEEITFLGSPFIFRRSQNILRLTFYYVLGFFNIFLGKNTKTMKRVIAASDLVVLNGGNLIRSQSITDFIRLSAFLYPLFLARRMKVPYVIFPQSTAALNRPGKQLVEPIFSDAKAVWIRERESLNKFQGIYKNINFMYAPDMAFHISSPDAKAILRKNSQKAQSLKIAVTLRNRTIGDIKPLPEQKSEEILKTVVSLIDHLNTLQPVSLTLVIQCDKDIEISEDTFQAITQALPSREFDISIVDTRDTYELLELYRQQDLLVGMRLHSIILALSVGTPCIGYFDRSWGLKNPGLLGMFHLPVGFIGEPNESLVANTIHVIKDIKNYRKAICEKSLSEKNDFAEKFIDRIRKDEKFLPGYEGT